VPHLVSNVRRRLTAMDRAEIGHIRRNIVSAARVDAQRYGQRYYCCRREGIRYATECECLPRFDLLR
jgi:hypothetical protein